MSAVTTRLPRSAAVGVLAALVLGIGAPAYADDGPGTFSGSPDGPSTATLGGTSTTTQTTPAQTGTTGTTGSTALGGGSTPMTGPTSSSTFPGLENLGACDPAAYGPEGYSPTLALPAPCIQPEPADPAEPGQPPAPPQITTQMVTAAATVAAPANPPHVEPGNISYVNIPNNYWTETDVVRDSVTLLGQTIPLVWTPTGTTWDFGDGSTATGEGVPDADLGAPGAIEHGYTRQGSYEITTTTTYDLTFVLPGQGAQTIPLTGSPSPAVTLPVREIQTLVSYVG